MVALSRGHFGSVQCFLACLNSFQLSTDVSSDPKHVGEAMVTKFARDLRVSLSAIGPLARVADR